MTYDEILAVLEGLAKSFPPRSKENEAIEFAAHAILFAYYEESKNQFEKFINERNRPLTGMEIIKLKTYGLEIPEEYKNPEITAIESEIDALASKITSFIPNIT